VAAVLVLGLTTNLLSLYVPKLSAGVIYGTQGSGFLILIAGIAFIVAVIQITISSYFSEKVALDLRAKLIDKIKDQKKKIGAVALIGSLSLYNVNVENKLVKIYREAEADPAQIELADAAVETLEKSNPYSEELKK
jgi:hypothetical protein